MSQGWSFFSSSTSVNFMDMTFHFKNKSIFRLANRHKCCIHSPKCYTNMTGTFCPQWGERGCLNTFCSNRNKKGTGSRKGRRRWYKNIWLWKWKQLPEFPIVCRSPWSEATGSEQWWMMFAWSPGMVSVRCEIGCDLRFNWDCLSDDSGLDSWPDDQETEKWAALKTSPLLFGILPTVGFLEADRPP